MRKLKRLKAQIVCRNNAKQHVVGQSRANGERREQGSCGGRNNAKQHVVGQRVPLENVGSKYILKGIFERD